MALAVKIRGIVTPTDGDSHFTDYVTSSQDCVAGREIASVIGGLTRDCDEYTRDDQWTQIMKALRIHGLQINFIER